MAKSLAGSKVAMLLKERRDPETGLEPWVTVNVVEVIVAGSMASLKVALLFRLMPTPMATSIGSVETTVGAMVSATVPVVKVHVLPVAKAFPAKSVKPVVMAAV